MDGLCSLAPSTDVTCTDDHTIMTITRVATCYNSKGCMYWVTAVPNSLEPLNHFIF